MRRTNFTRLLGATALGAGLLATGSALATNPLEVPDNGAVQFSRGGAWLATADGPIATHYNPAALATIGSAVSIDGRFSYNNLCYDRTDENGDPVGIRRQRENPEPYAIYKEACNERNSFPMAIPALSVAWRAADKLGFGIAVVPPAAYGTANEGWPAITNATDPDTGEDVRAPAPYRYQTLGNQSTILFPTASVGFEPFDSFRVGAGFVSGIAVFNAYAGGISQVNPQFPVDAAIEDSFSNLQVRDLFVPGFVASIHWSATRYLDLSVWGRVMDSIEAHEGDLQVNTRYFNGATGYDRQNPVCGVDSGTITCPGATNNGAANGAWGREIVEHFKFPFPPPEVRAGVRFHMPRSEATAQSNLGEVTVRDPLKDDIFDVELDGSFTANSSTDAVTIRFKYDEAAGSGPGLTPVGNLPPIADIATGFKDSWGFRLGGQFNAIEDKLAIMAGTWYETQSQKPELMTVSFPGPERGGFGGGLTLRQEFLDITVGYQYHWSAGLETTNGQRYANTGSVSDPTRGSFSVNNEPLDLPPELRREFRGFHVVNNGKITQYAHAFALGGTVRF